MATGGDLGTHGELAIGKAQMGMRQNDLPLRVAVFLWAVIALGCWIITQMVLPAGKVMPHWLAALILVFSGVIATAVAAGMSRRNARKTEHALAVVRAIDEKERNRQMVGFLKSKRAHALDEKR